MDHAIRRIVTGHDASGKAVVTMDGPAPNSKVRPGTGFISTLLWVTDESPARADTGTDRADRTMGVPPPANGSVLRVVEFPPVTPEAEALDQKAIVASMGADHNAHDGKAARQAFDGGVAGDVGRGADARRREDAHGGEVSALDRLHGLDLTQAPGCGGQVELGGGHVRNVEGVDGAVEAGVGVLVAPEADAGPFEGGDQGVRGEPL